MDELWADMAGFFRKLLWPIFDLTKILRPEKQRNKRAAVGPNELPPAAPPHAALPGSGALPAVCTNPAASNRGQRDAHP